MIRTRIAATLTVMLLAVPVAAAQDITTRTDDLIRQLGSDDPAVRGAALLDLKAVIHPEALAVLVRAMRSANRELAIHLVDILSAFKEPAKVPALVHALQTHGPDRSLEYQLVEMGAPAARALMDTIGCSNPAVDRDTSVYMSVVAGIFAEIDGPALPITFEALREDDACKRHTASQALSVGYGGRLGRNHEEPERIALSEMALLLAAIESEHDVIRNTALTWITRVPANDFESLDFSPFVDALIATYSAGQKPDVMVAIAGLLSEVKSPRVRRFMNAAVNAPNAEIRALARTFIAEQRRASERPQPARAPVTVDEKIAQAEDWGGSGVTNNTTRLIRLLADKEPRVRAAAARGLAELNAPATAQAYLDERERAPETAIPPLLKTLNDHSAEVRVAAADALGAILPRYWQESYLALVDEPDEELRRGAALAASVRDRLLAVLKDPDEKVVAAAARALGQIRSSAAVPLLTDLTRHTSAAVRADAVEALSNYPGEDAVSRSARCAVVTSLNDTDSRVRYVAARGLYYAFEKGERCTDDVNVLLTAFAQPALRESLYRPLGRIGDPRAIPVLLRDLKDWTGTNQACRPCDALAQFADPNLADALLPFLQSENPYVVLGVLGALAAGRPAAAVPGITPLLTHPMAGVRLSAGKTLLAIKGCPLGPDVSRLLADDNEDTRRQIAQEAAKCKDRNAVDALIRMVPSEPATAASALGEIGDTRAVAPIIAALGQARCHERGAVVGALAKLGDRRAVEPLIAELIRTKSVAERWCADEEIVRALGVLGDARAVPHLQKIVREADPRFPSREAEAAVVSLKALGAPVPGRGGGAPDEPAE